MIALDALADELLYKVLLGVDSKTIILFCAVNRGLRAVASDKRWYKLVNTEDYGPTWNDSNARFSATSVFVARRSQLTKLGLCHVWPQLGPSIRIVDLQESLGVDDSTLRDLAFHCKILEELSLAGCCLVTNKGISHVAENCSRLQSLVLTRCLQITDVSSVLQNCRELMALNLRACANILDEGLLAGLRVRHETLRGLGLRSCFNLTGMVVEQVLLKCPLDYVELENCFHVSELTKQAATALVTAQGTMHALERTGWMANLEDTWN